MDQSTRLTDKWVYERKKKITSPPQLQDPLTVKLVIISWFLRDWVLLVFFFSFHFHFFPAPSSSSSSSSSLYINGGGRGGARGSGGREGWGYRKEVEEAEEVEETSETPLTLTEAVVKEIGRSVNFFTVGVDQTQRRVRLGVVSISDRGVSN